MWYTLITALFRCPASSTELTGSSPQICRPYLTTRSYVAPYIQPYYNTYGAPYVDSARPHVEKVNKQFIQPSVKYGTEKYKQYGAPQVELVQQYGQGHWEKNLKPQLETVRLQIKSQYDSSLAPQLSRISAAVAPYYKASRQHAHNLYTQRIMPTYTTILPYLQNAYLKSHSFAMDIGFPYAQSARDSILVFWNRTLWPKVRILYGENVEPQLARIRERLGRYRDGKRMQSVMEQATR